MGTANRRTAECRMSNVEGMYFARRELLCRTVYFIKKSEQPTAQAKPSFEILRFDIRYSAVRCFVNPKPLNGYSKPMPD
jgi:hypothetical protein